MPLSRHSAETYPETSSHATCQETFGHGRLSPLSHCGLILECVFELISTLVKKKKKSAFAVFFTVLANIVSCEYLL